MKNNQKGYIVPLLIVIIAALVIGGGVYLYESKKVEVPVVANNVVQETVNVPATNDNTTPASVPPVPAKTVQVSQTPTKPQRRDALNPSVRKI